MITVATMAVKIKGVLPQTMQDSRSFPQGAITFYLSSAALQLYSLSTYTDYTWISLGK